MARKKVEEEGGGLPEWMATYSDLVTLLLTFFILLFSMASVDAAKFDQVAASLRATFSIFNMSGEMSDQTGDTILSVTDNVNAPEDAEVPPEEIGSKEHIEQLEGTVAEMREEIARLEEEISEYEHLSEFDVTEDEMVQLSILEARQQKLNNFKQNILEQIDKLGIGGYVSIEDQEEKLILRLSSQILFDSGSAELRPEGRDVMLALGVNFRDLDNLVEVQGHTDDRPIATYQFPSNWELSSERATNVVHILQDECGVEPVRLRATGFGEYQPIGDNTTPDGRQSNRRIDIVILTA